MQLARKISGESYTVDYAGLWIRLLALIIDGVILGVVIWVFFGLWPLAFGRGWLGGSAGATISYGEADALYWTMTLLVPFLMVVAYFICFWGWRGQTPGKMVMKIKIVRFTGEKTGWGDAVMRFLGFIISVLFALIGHIWIAFDSRRQGWHDKIAETYVIRVRRK
jgi:uncharacterized RDD family membrane protein YckC